MEDLIQTLVDERDQEPTVCLHIFIIFSERDAENIWNIPPVVCIVQERGQWKRKPIGDHQELAGHRRKTLCVQDLAPLIARVCLQRAKPT